MLMEMVKGRTRDRDRRAAEGGAARGDRHPADAGPAQVRAARPGRAQGRAAPRQGDAAARGVGRRSRRARAQVAWRTSTSARSTSCRRGAVKIVHAGEITVGVYNLNGEYYALEDRCSHDDGPALRGRLRPEEGVAICPRHGANIDIRTGRPLLAAGRRAGRRRSPSASRTESSRSRSRELDVAAAGRAATRRTTRYHDEEWGRPVRGRARAATSASASRASSRGSRG